MKKILPFITLALLLLVNPLWAEESEEEYEFLPVKDILFEGGYGVHNVSIGFGFRYDFIGLTIGATGFDNDIPPYQNDLSLQPSVKDFEEKKYTSNVVSIDLSYYYDLNDDFSLYGSIGYYSQADTILAYYYEDDSFYRYKNENVSGITFGAGFQYFISKYMTLGLAYHNKRGALLQLGFYWL